MGFIILGSCVFGSVWLRFRDEFVEGWFGWFVFGEEVWV